jgi:Tfp pilus assembly protein PilX
MTSPERSLSLHDQAGLIGKIAVVWIVVLLLVGLLVLDGISIVLTTLRLSNTAQAAASTAATAFHNGQDVEAACLAADKDLTDDSVSVPSNPGWCRIDEATGQATITLKKSASTLVLGRLSFTSDLTKVSVKESAEPAL